MKKIIFNIKRFGTKLGQMVAFILGSDCEIRREAVDAGLCDYSGQGRDKYGN